MTFSYTARTSTGQKTEGSLKADSEEQALAILHESGLFVISLKKRIRLVIKKEKRITLSLTHLSLFFNHLSAMLSMGGTLSQALCLLEKEMEEPLVSRLVKRVNEKLLHGHSLSESLHLSGKWPIGVISIIRAGEESGELLTVLQHLTSHFRWKRTFQKRLFSAFFYPAFVALVSLVVINILFFKVLPQLESTLNDLGIVFSPLFSISLKVIKIICSVGVIGGGAIIATIYCINHICNVSIGKGAWHWLLSKSRICRNISLARSFQMLAVLLKSGIPLLKALKLAGEISGNKKIRESFSIVAEHISLGHSLSQALLTQKEYLPPLIVPILALSERSGTLIESLIQISVQLNEDSQQNMKRLEVLIEPILITCLGVFLLIFISALFLPLFKTFQNISF